MSDATLTNIISATIFGCVDRSNYTNSYQTVRTAIQERIHKEKKVTAYAGVVTKSKNPRTSPEVKVCLFFVPRESNDNPGAECEITILVRYNDEGNKSMKNNSDELTQASRLSTYGSLPHDHLYQTDDSSDIDERWAHSNCTEPSSLPGLREDHAVFGGQVSSG